MQNKTKILGLIAGIALILFSIGIFIYTSTNSICKIGPAMCGSKEWAADIGLFLGLLAIILSFCNFNKNGKETVSKRNPKRLNGLTIFGIILIIISIAMAIVGFGNNTYTLAAAVFSATMILLAVPVAVAGIAITSIGVYNAIKHKKSHPILVSIFVIGIVTMLVFLL